MHQFPRLPGPFVRKFFRNRNIAVEILDQDFEISIQLEEGKASLIKKSAQVKERDQNHIP